MLDKNLLKTWFKSRAKPTQNQFYQWIDACFFKGEQLPASDVEGLETALSTMVTINNVRGLYIDYFYLEGDGTYLLTRGAIVTGIIIEPGVSSDISIGSTVGGGEHMAAITFQSGEWTTIPTIIGARVEQLVHFTGITSPTLIIILKNSIQLPI